MLTINLAPSLRKTLWERMRVRLQKSDRCWLWTGKLNTSGYGYLRHRGRSLTMHRSMYRLAYGPIPEGMLVCHRCDNRRCVRPDHLFLGTPADNMHDRDAKGRAAKGERHGMAKLTLVQVQAIRGEVARGLTHKAVARAFGVSRSHVGDLVRGKKWHATGTEG